MVRLNDVLQVKEFNMNLEMLNSEEEFTLPVKWNQPYGGQVELPYYFLAVQEEFLSGHSEV
jgi:hypothetical protein